MSALPGALDDEERAKLRPAPAPDHAGAMKAVLTDERFDDPDWIFERKLDGVRAIAIRSGAHPRLLSRNDLSMNARYPEIRERGVTWVEPTLVAQVGFTEWTRAGRLRHPRFLGLREDKAAREVVREE